MATFMTGQAPDIYDSRQLVIYDTISKQDPHYYDKYMSVVSATGRHVDSIRFSGLGVVQFKGEGSPIEFVAPVQGARRRTVILTWALGYRVTMEAMMDPRFDVLDRQPADLARSHHEHMELQAAACLDDSFDGNIYTGLDGRPLIDTAHTFLNHPLGSATTATNELSPGIPFGEEGLEAALTNLMLTESEEGRKIGASLMKGLQVIHHPSIMHLVQKTLKTEYKTGGNFNDVSVVATTQSGITPLTVPHLNDADSWWLAPKPGVQGDDAALKWHNRMSMTWIDPYTDNATRDRMYSALRRDAIEVTTWRGWVGSNV